MITLQGMRLNQKGYILYLTSATVEELKSWFDADRIYPDIWKREKPEGYQRIPDKERFMKIAEYVEGKLQIEETLLPNSLILNIRQKGAIDFNAFEKSKSKKTIESGEILINDEALPFFEVDGQHRIRGLIEAYKELKEKKSDDFEEIRSYPVPLTIIEGLDRPTEAMQFVVINTTQKKVDPALVLRILHKRFKDKGEKLEFFLRGQTWRLWAVEMCDQLNSDPNSPWCDKIIAPGDERKGRVISEQNFINSLETVYPSKKMEPDEIKNYLPLYWKAIEALWHECVGENAVKYSLQRTNGTVVFHWLFPFVYFKSKSLGSVKLKTFIEILQPIRKRKPPLFWERGGEAKLYTSKGSQKELVDNMIAYTLPGKEFKLAKFKGREGSKEAKTWDIASKLFPLRLYHLFTSDKLSSIDAVATGVYVFYSFTKQKFYVGRSGKADLKSRLQNHFQKKENEFHIFNYRLCKEPKEAHDLECALYHLLPDHLRINKEHPSAFAERKCPFCVTSV
jgi:DGQHR domain-containing protein